MKVRPATAADHAAVAAIWAPILNDTTITFQSGPRSPECVAEIIAERRKAGHEFFVAGEGARIVGFATYAQFRPGPGYATAMEHTVILSPDARGRGIGRALVGAVEDHARAAGAHTLIACISGENPAAAAFHGRLGFRPVGTIPEAGRKFDRWLDLILMMKFL